MHSECVASFDRRAIANLLSRSELVSALSSSTSLRSSPLLPTHIRLTWVGSPARNTALQDEAASRTGTCRGHDRAPGPACAARLQRASGQRGGRRLMRAKRRAPISCGHRCRRKEPVPADGPNAREIRVRLASPTCKCPQNLRRMDEPVAKVVQAEEPPLKSFRFNELRDSRSVPQKSCHGKSLREISMDWC